MSENNPSENVKETEEVPGLPPIFSVAEAKELGSRAYELLASKRSNDVERAEVCEVAGNRGNDKAKYATIIVLICILSQEMCSTSLVSSTRV